MNGTRLSPALPRLALAIALLASMPLAGWAQNVPAANADAMATMPGMDHGSMDGMAMPAPAGTARRPAHPRKLAPASTTHAHASSAMQVMDHGSMQGMDQGSMEGMDEGSVQHEDASSPQMIEQGSMPGMDDSSQQGMPMGPMQGGSPPPDARDPDYSAGTDYGPTHGLGMAMNDNPRFGKLLLNQLEVAHGRQGNGHRWDAEAWYGNDDDKLWLRTEGERARGALESADLEAFWNHTLGTFWNTQIGLRTDAGRGPDRTWAAFGIQGLAPYWFELEATGYVGAAGRTAARVRADYELLLTQRLVLQPEFDANLYGRADPARRLGAGLSDAELGLRLRYEIRRQFAPYIGVVWVRRLGGTADFARAEGEGIFDRQWVAGVRIWF
ncbi:copper resistance protein B [Frateuria terrea]|uniref:Copper resistance protein B n=1 Tax=Frateuria terrea TaxID=529704 RepID=A0A1H6VDM2_9GAMM|nr:copper resistance protein B [Frateuria terrea]SEJ01094.1 copper resistance protein B [Frateuria terrea]SFP65230.1 copper resistance protein B [Frateuria terrea]